MSSGKNFYGKIEEFMRRHVMDVDDFCRRAEIDEKTLNNWQSGRHNPSPAKGERVEKFMKAYDQFNPSKQNSMFAAGSFTSTFKGEGAQKMTEQQAVSCSPKFDLTPEEKCQVIAAIMCSPCIPDASKPVLVKKLFPNL